MNRNDENWLEIRPPIEIKDDEFIFRPKHMVVRHPYMVKFKGDEFILIKRNQDDVDLYVVSEKNDG